MEISTKRYKPWRLTYYEAYQSEEDAREREVKLKHHGNAIRELKKRTIRSLKNGALEGLPSTIFKKLKNGAGFTLIEMVVAVAVFTLLVGAASGAFVSSLRSQKQGLATQEILDQTSYLMEYMSRALRMAKKDITGACTGTAKLNYIFESQCLKFVNYNNECQQFCLEDTRLKDENGAYLTSENLQVSSFAVTISGATQPPVDYLQPRVTIFFNIAGQEQSSIKIQTTVSQRNLDVSK